MRNIPRSCVAKNFNMTFCYVVKVNVTKCTIYTISNFEIMTFKLNIPTYIPLKINYVVMIMHK